MNLSHNTILITGGASGIGYELAKRLAPDNAVIICGLPERNVQKAAKSIPGVYGFDCDISSEKELLRMVKTLSYNFVDLDVIIHADLQPGLTDFLAVELFGMFVSLLSVQPEPLMVNIEDLNVKSNISADVRPFLKENNITFFELQLLFDSAGLSQKGCQEVAGQIIFNLENELLDSQIFKPYDS